MRRLARSLGYILFAVSIGARADFIASPADLHTGFTVDAGYSIGGEDLNRKDLNAGRDIQGHYLSGEGVSLGLGAVEMLGDSGFGLKQELGAWIQLPLSTTPAFTQPGLQDPAKSLVFLHSYGNALAFYRWQDFAVGAGAAYQTHVQTQDGKVGVGTLQDFEDAHGWILMLQYGALGLRYTHISYKVKHDPAIPALDGSNVGITISYQFY